MLCSKCAGTGEIMGPGMMFKDCSCQYDTETTDNVKPINIDRRSKAYRDAINKLMRENEMSRDKAIELFEEEFYKIA